MYVFFLNPGDNDHPQTAAEISLPVPPSPSPHTVACFPVHPSGSLLAQCWPLRLTAIKRHSRTHHSQSFQAQALELQLSQG